MAATPHTFLLHLRFFSFSFWCITKQCCNMFLAIHFIINQTLAVVICEVQEMK